MLHAPPTSVRYGLALLPLLLCGSFVRAEDARPIVPTETINLLNKDLSQWYVFLQDSGRHETAASEPRGIFKVQDDGILRISGETFGGLITKKEYANYYLVMEYRWGTKTWPPREDRARDGGLLLHCQGPDGNFGGSGGKPGPWMTSIECQVIEGGVGDILVLRGKDENGEEMVAEATVEAVRDRDGEPVWKAGAPAERFPKGRINWFGRDPDWADKLGFRGKDDVDSPGQEWTKLECFMSGDSLVYRVNGTVVNRATRLTPSHGKILLQTEGAEMFVRKLELRPLPEKLP
jgi:hypothetical protein